MIPLDKILRNQLERAVKNARNTAEKGAHAALGQLGVADPTPAAHLSDTDRELRRRLRAHGRQLGDSLNGGKVQSIDRLVKRWATSIGTACCLLDSWPKTTCLCTPTQTSR